jgi:subtilisin family serine protease
MQTNRQIMRFSLFSVLFLIAVVLLVILAIPNSDVLSKEINSYPFGEVVQPELVELMKSTQADEKISVIVFLREQADLSKVPDFSHPNRAQEIVRLLKSTASASQRDFITLVNDFQRSGEVEKYIPFWIFNGFSMSATPRVIEALASHPQVMSIRSDHIELIPSAIEADLVVQDNLALINAPQVWVQGWMGQGVVVANMDTGVDLYHPDLKEKWRGGTNSWYDPFGEHDFPTDLDGHGTMTMGVILGGNESGTSIGVAPEAKWIAVKIFDDDGSSTATAVHLGFQWLLDPDNDPETDDSPDVVNNSWSFGNPGCNTEFLLDIQALYAAGILPVFSAGNFGPNDGTSVSPANYPESFAVGAVTNEDVILGLSSRGPSLCAEEEAIYPEITAPGYKIYTSDTYGFYTTATGTSLAAPHISGSLALLLSAFPTLNIQDQQTYLFENAVDLGEVGPDNIYGYGRVDVDQSYQAIIDSGVYPTATPMPIPNSEPLYYYFPIIKFD